IANNKADVSVTKISEAIPVGEGAVSTTGEQVAPGAGTEGATPAKKSNAWIWIVAIVLIAVIVGAGISLKKKK
ncbi:MAG: hypothetical protein WC584_04235, partial [Candidatus Pacearchaeota archaeon]